MKPRIGMAIFAAIMILTGNAWAQDGESKAPEWAVRWDDPDAPPEALAERYSEQELANRAAAIAFYRAALNEKDWNKAASYIGDTYIQHNPRAVDGPEGFQNLVERLARDFPDNRGEIKHVYVDGDIVVMHVHAQRTPEQDGWSVAEILRFDENAKAVEHWDVIQPVVPAEEAMNDNSMW